MRSLYRVGALAVSVAMMCVSGMALAQPAKKISLNILYMGQPDTAAGKGFHAIPGRTLHASCGDGRGEI